MRELILNWPRGRKRAVVMAMDFGLAASAMWLSFTLRLDAPHRPDSYEWLAYLAPPILALGVFARRGLYRAMFRHTGMVAMLDTGKAVGVYGLVLAPIIWTLFSLGGIPRSLILLHPLILFVLVAASRTIAWQWLASRDAADIRRLVIYGAGSAGVQTAAALAGNQRYCLMAFLDDDPTKLGRSINGVMVHSPKDAEQLAERHGITDVLLALPSVSRVRRNAIIAGLQFLPVRIRSLPGLEDLASGRVAVDDFQDLDIEDLLGREPVQVQQEWLDQTLNRRVVVVTGAGGSIGSELCRQIAREGPKQLLLMEHSEYALYAIHQELTGWSDRTNAGLEVVPLLVNVCNYERVSSIFRQCLPDAVYHAAAYKHVPMIEANPGEGITNNVLGTVSLARAALECGVERFVLVSTDKAVRPTNVMGATKRVAEQVLQALAASEPEVFESAVPERGNGRRTRFSMVRFGNVLGSSGSVVPLFREQIAAGGPLTITHPEVSRYFMTIPEASQLVLHAGAIAEGGDLFVLDMGQPVKILDLAQRMVALAGRTIRSADHPTGDIDLKLIGLRPGEKLQEELLIGENPMPTAHPRIIRAREEFMDWTTLSTHLQTLLEAARSEDAIGAREALQIIVPGYVPRVDSRQPH
ncbi:polysaccharide biosynthesis protein [Variovorax soli]|uniref:polysaccharide biosynthesis protein n=1 Tax=Variovorax soli TaxID=376815 RepID=UPI0008399062